MFPTCAGKQEVGFSAEKSRVGGEYVQGSAINKGCLECCLIVLKNHLRSWTELAAPVHRCVWFASSSVLCPAGGWLDLRLRVAGKLWQKDEEVRVLRGWQETG